MNSFRLHRHSTTLEAGKHHNTTTVWRTSLHFVLLSRLQTDIETPSETQRHTHTPIFLLPEVAIDRATNPNKHRAMQCFGISCYNTTVLYSLMVWWPIVKCVVRMFRYCVDVTRITNTRRDHWRVGRNLCFFRPSGCDNEDVWSRRGWGLSSSPKQILQAKANIFNQFNHALPRLTPFDDPVFPCFLDCKARRKARQP